jgi:hypothetical protein
MSEPWFDPNTFGGTLGGIMGILGGAVYGPLVGFCAPKGKFKGFVLGYHFTLLVSFVGLAAVGVYAYFVRQPNGISFALIYAGILGGILFSCLTPVVLMRYGLAVSRFLPKSGKPPETTGPPVQLRAITSADAPISKSASWQGDVLELRSDKAATQKLFDVELSQVEQCKLVYRFLIHTKDLSSVVYPEMWCRIPKKGEFFSRGLENKIKGTNDWMQVEIPFYLQKGQLADLLHLNLVFEDEGTVRLKGIEVTSAQIA